MKKLFLLLLIMFDQSICSVENNIPNLSSEVYATVAKAQKRIAYQLNLSGFSVSTAGGPTTGGFTSLSVDFQSNDKCFSKNEGRFLAINAMEMFLKEINKTEKIQSVLTPSPFELKNISVTVFNQNPTPEKLGTVPYLEGVWAQHDKIKYLYIVRMGEGYHSIVTETYEEALAILEREKTDCTPIN